MTKTCKVCSENKPTTEYYKHSMAKDKLHPMCKSCMLDYNKKWVKTPKGKADSKKQDLKQFKKWGSGVYGIYSNGIPLYIGESSGLNKRILQHKRFIKNTSIKHKFKHEEILYSNIRKHPNIIIGIIEECNNHKKREEYYINKLKPKYNE